MSIRMSRPRKPSWIIGALAALPCIAAAADLQAIADRLEIQDVVGARYAMARPELLTACTIAQARDRPMTDLRRLSEGSDSTR